METVATPVQALADRPGGGFKLLALLGFAGWDVAVLGTRRIIGGGVEVRASRPDRKPISEIGATVPDVAPLVFQKAMRPA